MAKEHVGRTKATATKTLYAVMKEISRRGGSMPAKDLYPFVEANVSLTDWEKEPAGKMQYIRWTNSFQFYSIDYSFPFLFFQFGTIIIVIHVNV